MESCKHMNFEADVKVARIEDKGRFMAEIHIRCKDCGTPFQFMGLKPGFDFDGATVSLWTAWKPKSESTREAPGRTPCSS